MLFVWYLSATLPPLEIDVRPCETRVRAWVFSVQVKRAWVRSAWVRVRCECVGVCGGGEECVGVSDGT